MTDARDFFIDLVNGYRSAKIVFVAHGIGLFAALDRAPRTTAELAEELGTDERATTLLTRALVALGVVARAGDRFANAAIASAHLVPGRPGYVGANLAYQELLWSGWSSLDEIVRSGEPPRALTELLSPGSPFIRDYLRGVEQVSRAPAREVMRLLGDRPMTSLLDVGGGLGTYARAFVAADQTRSATLFDLPATIALAREELASDQGRDRIHLVEGDYLRDDFAGGSYDLVLLSHVTHDEPDDVNLRLATRAHAALGPGGRLAIHDFTVDADGCGPLFSTLFSVNMLVYTRGGRVYSVAEYRALLEAAGFRDVSSHAVLPELVKTPTVLVVGEK